MIAAGFGIAWTLWGASGLTGGPAAAVRVGGILTGALILVLSALLQRQAHRASRVEAPEAPCAESGSMFSSSGYRLVVALEVIALIAGGVLLGLGGRSEYTITWFASAVVVHFLILGRLFWAGFYWLGAALLAAGIAGAIVGFAGASSGAIRAVSGLIASVSLFAAGAWTILAGHPPPSQVNPR